MPKMIRGYIIPRLKYANIKKLKVDGHLCINHWVQQTTTKGYNHDIYDFPFIKPFLFNFAKYLTILACPKLNVKIIE